MKFSARVKRGSAIDRAWRASSRLGGVLHGVGFKLKGGFFESIEDDIDADKVAALESHPAVELVAAGIAPAAPVEAVKPVPEVAPDPVPAPVPEAVSKTAPETPDNTPPAAA